MTDPDRLTAEVLVAAEVPADQEQAVIDAFGALGVAVRSRVVPVHRGAADTQWLLLAMLPLQAFLSTLGASSANGATQALKRMVGRIHGSKPEAAPAPRPLILQDAATRLQIVLEAGLPAEAYDSLVSLDLSKFRHGPLHYDQHRGAWRSELDE
jgi:hypothetical protein